MKGYTSGTYVKEDFPHFTGDNFALGFFNSICDDSFVCDPEYCPHQPLNVGKIQKSD